MQKSILWCVNMKKRIPNTFEGILDNPIHNLKQSLPRGSDLLLLYLGDTWAKYLQFIFSKFLLYHTNTVPQMQTKKICKWTFKYKIRFEYIFFFSIELFYYNPEIHM